jgi:hypothetical protein
MVLLIISTRTCVDLVSGRLLVLKNVRARNSGGTSRTWAATVTLDSRVPTNQDT